MQLTSDEPFVPLKQAQASAGKFIELLDLKLAERPENPLLWRRRADLTRRIGMLEETRNSLQKYCDLKTPESKSEIDQKLMIPPGIQDADGYEVPPVCVIDGFAPNSLVTELLQHVAVNQSRFQRAKVNSADPKYRDDVRRTEIFHQYEVGRAYFLTRLRDMQPELCRLFDMPVFEIGRMETKLSNHISGGHFRPHNDDNKGSGPDRRRLSWLFYFHRWPKQFAGGELFLMDTCREETGGQRTFRPESYTRVEPINNRLIVFRSADFHAVSETTLPSGEFMDGRMAVAGHIRCT